MKGPIDTVVIGATGYVGGELLRLIAGHPQLSLAAAVSTSRAGSAIGELFPALAPAYAGRSFAALEDALAGIGEGGRLAVFSAAPHGASAAGVSELLAAAAERSLEVHVVDVSADFRYPTAEAFAGVYGQPHAAPELLGEFRSALPEHLAADGVEHVGHPGCFATAVLLAAVPLFDAGLVDEEIFVSAITGSTGSGRSPSAGTHHPERHGNLYAYKPLAHRHEPEITTLIRNATGRDPRVNFVPHSGPFARGIHVTAMARLRGAERAEHVASCFRDFYARAPFVSVVPETPRLKDVVASNYCHIGVAARGDSIVVLTAIDNLVKGAAGGALQWMNRLWSLAEETGLMAPSPGWT